MKKLISAVIIFAIIISSLFYYRRQVALNFIQKALKKNFTQNSVLISELDFNPFSSLELKGLKVLGKSDDVLLTIRGIKINYKISHVFNKQIESIVVSGLEVKKIKIDKILLSLYLKGNTVYIPNFNFNLWSGAISGSAEIKPSLNQPLYKLEITANKVDLGSLSRDLELEDKIELTGISDFKLHLEGKGSQLTNLTGNLFTEAGGGKFFIKDKNMANTLPVSDPQATDIVLESLKNYYYDKGEVKVSLEGNNVILNIFMDGDLGKRDLTIVAHDFKL